jgi:hypothetical protein
VVALQTDSATAYSPSVRRKRVERPSRRVKAVSGGTGHQELRGVGISDAWHATADRLFHGEIAGDVREYGIGELRAESKALAAVARLRHDKQGRCSGPVADHGGYRCVGLAGQS